MVHPFHGGGIDEGDGLDQQQAAVLGGGVGGSDRDGAEHLVGLEGRDQLGDGSGHGRVLEVLTHHDDRGGDGAGVEPGAHDLEGVARGGGFGQGVDAVLTQLDGQVRH